MSTLVDGRRRATRPRWQRWRWSIGRGRPGRLRRRAACSARRSSSAPTWPPTCSTWASPWARLAILMIYHLTGGAWGFLIRRILEAGMRTLPLLALLLRPDRLRRRAISIPGRSPRRSPPSDKLQRKQIYLNVPFFWAGPSSISPSGCCIAYFLTAWSRRQDRTGDTATGAAAATA